jgi:CRISPR system Cascade subunit CasC
VHVSQAELTAIDALVETKIQDHTFKPSDDDLKLLRKDNIDVDIALWGRMLASSPDMNIEAACQVAHAFSVNAVTIEDDYFTALDDLNDGREDAGAGHVDDAGFGSGLFYSYICVNNELLLKNLGGNKALAKKTIEALIKAITTVTPSGKQNSFATRAYACYGLVEVGNQQPRSLAMSYLKSISVKNENLAEQAIKELEQHRDNFDAVYGKCTTASFNAVAGTGKVEDVINKAAGVFA